MFHSLKGGVCAAVAAVLIQQWLHSSEEFRLLIQRNNRIAFFIQTSKF